MSEKHTNPEDEYFAQEELAKLRRQIRDKTKEMAADEAARLKEVHWMRCPKCGQELTEVPFNDVKVDTCFSCGGMFLDKGEVEKIASFKEPSWFDRMAMRMFGPDE